MMEELSLNILDIVQNSISANGMNIRIGITVDNDSDRLIVQVEDDGKGMSPDFLAQVTNPFVTTRTTRKVGLGISFFKEAAEAADGVFQIRSVEKKGTCVRAEFQKSHIDRQPLGDMVGTLSTLILLNPDVNFYFNYCVDDKVFDFSTVEIREQLGGEVRLSHPEVIAFISEYLSENMKNLNGGI